MRGTVLTWEQLQQQDPKQTAVIVTYRREDTPSWKRTRVLVRGWMSRDEAWYWCQANGIRRWAPEGSAHVEAFKLLRLSKVVKELEATKPKDTSAIRVA